MKTSQRRNDFQVKLTAFKGKIKRLFDTDSCKCYNFNVTKKNKHVLLNKKELLLQQMSRKK